MFVLFTRHARERMERYDLTETQIRNCLAFPESVLDAENDRKIAQKPLNGYVLRVIFEVQNDTYLVITTYKAKRKRYEIQIR